MSSNSLSSSPLKSAAESKQSPHEKVCLTGSSQDIVLWIWENLVTPGQVADTLQGEVVRVLESLAWEAQNNGNLNWNTDFDKMIVFLRQVFTGSESVVAGTLTDEEKSSVEADLNRLANFILPTELDSRVYVEELPYVKEDLYDRLAEQLINFCRHFPETLPLR